MAVFSSIVVCASRSFSKGKLGPSLSESRSPVWAAIGAIAALAADLTVVVEKKSENKTSD